MDSETAGMTALHEEAGKLGYSLPLAQALEEFRGRQMAVCIEMIEVHIRRPAPAGFMAMVRLAMAEKFRTGLAPMPGAAQLLQALRQAGVPYCIASNGPQDKMELTLGLSGLQAYFEKHVFSAYEVGHWKPSPELFFHAAREMGVEAMDCAVVEDSLPGIAAGAGGGHAGVFNVRRCNRAGRRGRAGRADRRPGRPACGTGLDKACLIVLRWPASMQDAIYLIAGSACIYCVNGIFRHQTMVCSNQAPTLPVTGSTMPVM